MHNTYNWYLFIFGADFTAGSTKVSANKIHKNMIMKQCTGFKNKESIFLTFHLLFCKCMLYLFIKY